MSETEVRERERAAWDAGVEHIKYLIRNGYATGVTTMGPGGKIQSEQNFITEARDQRYPQLTAHIRDHAAVEVGVHDSCGPGSPDPVAQQLMREREPGYAGAKDRLVQHVADLLRVGVTIRYSDGHYPVDVIDRAGALLDIERARRQGWGGRGQTKDMP